MSRVFIGVGTNIDREKHVIAAIKELAELGRGLIFSSIYQCPALGFDGPYFYNFVVALTTSYSCEEFAKRLRQIECRYGRAVDAKKYQDRTLDLDILLFGDLVQVTAPTLPREDLYKYNFVIEPMYELVPELIVPDSQLSIEQIWRLSRQNASVATLNKVESWAELLELHMLPQL